MKGTVKFYDGKKRFGFIAGEDGTEYFVHESAIKDGPLKENDEVEFEGAEGDRGPKAVNVTKAASDAPAEEAA